MAKQEGSAGRQRLAFNLMAWGQLGTGFATYAAGAIMILYLYEPLHVGGLGVDRITASQIMAVFTSLGYFAGIAGSYAADRLVGLRKPYLFGTLLKILAIALLAIPHGGLILFFTSLGLQIVAAGVTGQSLNALVGLIYRHHAALRNHAFRLIYIMNNIGAAGPFITGAVAVQFGYNAGFLVAAVVLLLTTLPYLFFQRQAFGELGTHAPDQLQRAEQRQLSWRLAVAIVAMAVVVGGLLHLGWLTARSFSNAVGLVGIVLPVGYMVKIIRSAKVTALEAQRVKSYGWFLIGNALSMLVATQSTGIVSLYTLDHVELNVWGLRLSAASFQTIPALLAVLFGTIIGSIWKRLGPRQPNEALKYGVGLLFWGAASLAMTLPLQLVPADKKASPLWIVLFAVLMVVGESITSPIGMAQASAVAPAAFITQMMTVFTLSNASGTGLAAIVATFYTKGHEVLYFVIIGAIVAAWGLLMIVSNRQIARGIQSVGDAPKVN